MNPNPTAVELDDFLARLESEWEQLTPEQRNYVAAELSRVNNVAYTDQLAAARRDGIALSEFTTGKAAQQMPTARVDDWLRLGLLDTFTKWIAGKGKTCYHNPNYMRPEPIWACAWKPGLVVCNYCQHLLRAADIVDSTCDCCGHVCAGINAGDPIYPVTIWFGALGYRAGMCSDCRTNSKILL